MATSTTEAEYVAAASCCGQVLWIQNQMLDYGFNFMNTKIYIDNESTICIVKNPVYHSKTKHIAIRHHFIRDAYEKKLIQVLKIHTDDNAVLEYNPGSICHLETKDKDDGKIYFKRMYICFKGIKQAIGRDGNNQMYPIAWVVVGVENKDNWAWFMSLFQEDLELGYGGGVTVISDGHKGLIEAVAGILPDSEHRQCARHIYANFKKKWSGLQYKRLFWGAASCIVDSQFLLKMEEIKELDPTAYKCFDARIVPARGKPIITMLEDIRIYVMQRICHMNKVLVKLEDKITLSVRKRLEYLKEKQSWLVYPSGFREVEVRRGDYAYGFNLHTKHRGCKFWELSGIPCVHAMAAYYHMKMELELGIIKFLLKQSWYNAYQYSIRPVPGSKLWKTYDNPSPYPPIERKRLGRPRKQRIIHLTEDDNHVTRLGRVMHCHTCWEVGHNKKGCQNQPRPKPLGLDTTIGNTNVIDGSSKKRGTIRIGSPIKRGEDNQVTEDTSMGDANLIAEEYQHKIDMEALAEVQREIAAEDAEQERIRQIWVENEASDLYWENMAKEFRDDELNRPEDSLEAAYSFDTISKIRDDELNVHQVSMDLPVNEAPENCTTEESQVQDPDPKPTIPTQESQVHTRSKIRKQVAATTRSTADKAFDVSDDED
ncbi:zinc finger, PMZ-type containing protein [Tanacetum coccineum]